MSFSEMMQQAIQIRTSTDAKLRVDFDSRPKFQQSSMFATQEVREARSLPLEERLAVCTAMKLRGNEQMRIRNYDEARQTYEQALAVFWYLDNLNDGWKTSGIKDEDITEVNFCPACEGKPLEDETRDLKVALLLNIARVYSAQSDYATSAKACGAALATNPSCAKALYLRGKALVTPASAGAFETEEAIRDVSRAAELAPGDNLVRSFLAKLRAEKARQKEADRATFAGMFDRGSVCDPEAASNTTRLHAPTHGGSNSNRGALPSRVPGEGGEALATGLAVGGGGGSSRPKNGSKDDDRVDSSRREGRSGAGGRNTLEMRRDVEERVAFFRGMVRECDEEGREEEANQYRERVAAIEEILSEYDRQERERVAGLKKAHAEVDWRNPSEAMREKAKEEEYDLNNPSVIRFLVKMQEAHQAKLEAERSDSHPQRDVSGGVDGEEDEGGRGSIERQSGQSNEDDDQKDWTEEIWEGAILCMTRSELTSLLKEELGTAPRPDMPLHELRNLAVSKLLGGRSSTGRAGSDSSATSDASPKRKRRADWKITATISLLLFAFKAYQMGLMTWLLTGGNPSAGAVGASGSAPSAIGNGNRAGQRTEAARGRRGRRGWERRTPSSAVRTDRDDTTRRGESIAVGDADVRDSSLAAHALASASPGTSPSQESLGGGGGCENTFDDASCVAGTESGERAVNPVAQDEFEFLVDK